MADYQIPCAHAGCDEEGEEFFEYDEDLGNYFCWQHYGEELDKLEQTNPTDPPLDHRGRKMWRNADTGAWCEVRG